MDFLVVSVFLAETNPLRSGNPLAVFPEPDELDRAQMRSIAQTFNLSETTFVTSTSTDAYDVRIFTPRGELAFAGHPTLGTAWVLRRLGLVRGDDITQHSAAGETPVRFSASEELRLHRTGASEADLTERDPAVVDRLSKALGLTAGQVGLEARELGRSGRLEPAFSSAGERLLMAPLRDPEALASCAPRSDLLGEFGEGVYCFTAMGAGRLRARGFYPGFGIAEDPATGAAAAALGLYLAERVGSIEAEIAQGVEMGRPSRLLVKAGAGEVSVGGRCGLISNGRLEARP